MPLIAKNVAPNYDVRQEETPLYRVDFWEELLMKDNWDLDTWILKDCASVFEAIAWAQANAGKRIIRLMVSVSASEETGEMAVLFGEDPTAGDAVSVQFVEA